MKKVFVLVILLMASVLALDCVSTSYTKPDTNQYLEVGFYYERPVEGTSLRLKVKSKMPAGTNLTFDYYSEDKGFLGETNYTIGEDRDYSDYFAITTPLKHVEGGALPQIYVTVMVNGQSVAEVGTSTYSLCFMQSRKSLLDVQGKIEIENVWNEDKKICMSLKNIVLIYYPIELEYSKIYVNDKEYKFDKTPISKISAFEPEQTLDELCFCTVEEQNEEKCIGNGTGYDYDGSKINVEFRPYAGMGDVHLGFIGEVSQHKPGPEITPPPQELPEPKKDVEPQIEPEPQPEQHPQIQQEPEKETDIIGGLIVKILKQILILLGGSS